MMNLRRVLSLLAVLLCPTLASATFNIWTSPTVAIAQVSSDAPEQPTVFFENSGCVIVASPCFKMWFTTGTATTPVGINYAESTNGTSWTRYGSNPLIASQWGARVFKNGSTYYLYSTAQVFATGINVRTSSDGITWSAPTNNIITTSVSPGFDHAAVGQLNVVAVVNGTWYGYYWGSQLTGGGTENFYQGLATSSDGITWTKDAGNPVAAFNSGTFVNGLAWNGASSLGFATVGGAYYAWGQIAAQTYPSANSNQPSDMTRWRAVAPNGPWVPINVETLSRSVASEQPNTFKGQIADPSLIEVNGTTYMYYTASTDGTLGNTYTVNVTTASKTLAQLVLTYEGNQNIPLSGGTTLNLTTLASDNFNRADGALGANWTKLNNAAFVAGQIVSNQVTSTVAGSSSEMWYNAVPFPNDQWAQVTVAKSQAVSFVGVDLRSTAGGNSYRFYWNGTTGGSGTWLIGKVVAGTFTTITSNTATFNVGDKFMGTVAGTTLAVYQNGLLLGVGTDSSIASGSAGLLIAPITSTNNAFIDDWSAGGFQEAPSLLGSRNVTAPYTTP